MGGCNVKNGMCETKMSRNIGYNVRVLMLKTVSVKQKCHEIWDEI